MKFRLSWLGFVALVVLVVVFVVRPTTTPTTIRDDMPTATPLPSTAIRAVTTTGSAQDTTGDEELSTTLPAATQSGKGSPSSNRVSIVEDTRGIVMVEGDCAATHSSDEHKAIPRVPISYLRPVDSIPDDGSSWLSGVGSAPLTLLPGMNRSFMRQETPTSVLEAAKEAEGWYSDMLKEGLLPRIDRNIEPFQTAGPSTVEPVWSDTTDIRLTDVRGANSKPSAHTKVEYDNLAEEEGAAFQSIVRSNWKVEDKADLEFVRSVPPTHWYLKSKKDLETRWINREPRSTKDGRRSVVRVACLYAGFLRDYKQMFESCRGKDCSGKLSKSYGAQRVNILDSTNCDVYMSTWDIVGAGRFFSTTYDMKQAVTLEDVRKLYGDRLGGLHVQKYAVYERVWRIMSGVARLFPQVRTTHSSAYRFWSRPEANLIFRANDYSQSYKHWCVVQLSMLAGFKHDAYIRLRPDLRTMGRLSNFQFAHEVMPAPNAVDWEVKKPVVMFTVERAYARKRPLGGSGPPEEFAFDRYGMNVTTNPLAQGARIQYISDNRLHVQNFDYADFGFMGSQQLLQHLTVPWLYCLMPPSSASPYTTLSLTTKRSQTIISEYNLVLWRSIFDGRWEVDDGRMYLRVNRMRGAKTRPSPPAGR